MLPGRPEITKKTFTESSRAPRHRRVLPNMDPRPPELDFPWQAKHFLHLGSNPLHRRGVCRRELRKPDALDIKSCAQATHLLGGTSNPMHRRGVFSIEFKSAAQAWCFNDFMITSGEKKYRTSKPLQICVTAYAFAGSGLKSARQDTHLRAVGPSQAPRGTEGGWRESF